MGKRKKQRKKEINNLCLDSLVLLSLRFRAFSKLSAFKEIEGKMKKMKKENMEEKGLGEEGVTVGGDEIGKK